MVRLHSYSVSKAKSTYSHSKNLPLTLALTLYRSKLNSSPELTSKSWNQNSLNHQIARIVLRIYYFGPWAYYSQPFQAFIVFMSPTVDWFYQFPAIFWLNRDCGPFGRLAGKMVDNLICMLIYCKKTNANYSYIPWKLSPKKKMECNGDYGVCIDIIDANDCSS